jgi:GLPGLI family protein
MKYLILMILSVLPFLASAQISGKIVYEEKMDLHRRLPPERAEMKDMIPQFNSSFWEMTFSGNESIYKAKKQEEQEFTGSSGGAHMTMRMGRDNRELYKNLDTEVMIDSREFMQKQFLIKGSPTSRKWKIGKNQKEILGYNCLEASTQVDSVTHLVAWFTPQIEHFSGPADFQGLPGMILMVDTNDGERTITATEITFEQVDTAVIIAPTKGKEVTDEEFTKIRDEKMKEMGVTGPGMGGGHQIMIIRQ